MAFVEAFLLLASQLAEVLLPTPKDPGLKSVIDFVLLNIYLQFSVQ